MVSCGLGETAFPQWSGVRYDQEPNERPFRLHRLESWRKVNQFPLLSLVVFGGRFDNIGSGDALDSLNHVHNVIGGHCRTQRKRQDPIAGGICMVNRSRANPYFWGYRGENALGG